jgi:hypothetical protein
VSGRYWTDELDAQLATLRAAGLSYRDIGKRLGRSPASVGGRFNRLFGTAQPKRPAAAAPSRAPKPSLADINREFVARINALRAKRAAEMADAA